MSGYGRCSVYFAVKQEAQVRWSSILRCGCSVPPNISVLRQDKQVPFSG